MCGVVFSEMVPDSLRKDFLRGGMDLIILWGTGKYDTENVRFAGNRPPSHELLLCCVVGRFMHGCSYTSVISAIAFLKIRLMVV
jgi:hypothetical protein